MRQQRGRKTSGRTRRVSARPGRGSGRPRPGAAGPFLGQLRRRARHGFLGRIRLGTAGASPRWRRWALALALLGVVVVPYPTQGAAGAPPAAACRFGCRPGAVPSMVRWTASLPGSWNVAPGLTGTVPAAGLTYASVGGGVAAVGVGLTVYGYSSASGALEWQDTLTGFPAGAAIASVRAWPGEVTAGVTYQPGGSPGARQRAEVVISDALGAQTGRYPAAAFGGAVAGTAAYTVIVGATAVTSYDNATGHVRWRRSTGPVAQAWRTDGDWLYVAQSARGFVDSAPVTALRRIDMATGAELVVQPIEGLAFRGTLSTAFDGVVLFSSAAGVTAYDSTTGARLWSAGAAVPEGTDRQPRRIYLTEGSNLVGVDPRTGRVRATASGSAVNGAAGVYVVRGGVALGLDQGAGGDAWGFDLAVQRVTLAAAGLPWPHYFVDLSGLGGSADPVSDLVIIAACTQLAPAPPAPPAPSAPPSTSASSGSGSGSATAPASPSTTPSASPDSSAPATQSPGASPPASAGGVGTGQGCLRPRLVGLNL